MLPELIEKKENWLQLIQPFISKFLADDHRKKESYKLYYEKYRPDSFVEYAILAHP